LGSDTAADADLWMAQLPRPPPSRLQVRCSPAVRQLGEILLPFPMRANRVSVPEVAPSSRHHDAASTAMSCASGWDTAVDADLWTARLRLPPPPRLQVPGDLAPNVGCSYARFLEI